METYEEIYDHFMKEARSLDNLSLLQMIYAHLLTEKMMRERQTNNSGVTNEE